MKPKSVLNWHNDPFMKRLLREERERETREAIQALYEAGILAYCPGGRVKLTPAARQAYRWYLL
jgi:hypothetical protein